MKKLIFASALAILIVNSTFAGSIGSALRFQHRSPLSNAKGRVALDDEISTISDLLALIARATANSARHYDATLVADVTVAKPITVPANISLKTMNGARMIGSDQVAITFLGEGIGGDPTWQIFAGFRPGAVKWTSRYPKFRPEWWGAVADGSTDCLGAFDQMLAAMANVRVVPQGGEIELIGGNFYYLSGTLHIQRNVLIHGAGWSSGLKFAPNTAGIILHAVSTRTGALNWANGTSGGSVLQNFSVVGQVGPNTSSVSLNDLTLARTSGEPFETTRFQDGNTITVDGVHYEIENSGLNNASTLLLKKPEFLVLFHGGLVYNGGYGVFSNAFRGASVSYIRAGGSAWTSAGTVTTVNPSGTGGISPGTLAVSGNLPADGVYTLRINSFTEKRALASRFNRYHGIDIRANPVSLQKISVDGFAGAAFQFDSTATPTFAAGTEPNSNNSSLTQSKGVNCTGPGIRTKGTNSNVLTIEKNDFSNNGGRGIYENAFLGNQYDNNHVSYNERGAFFGAIGNTTNLSVWISQYAEGGEPDGELGANNVVIGGNFTLDISQEKPRSFGNVFVSGPLTRVPMDVEIPMLSAQSSTEVSVNVIGANIGDPILASPQLSIENGIVWSAYVSAPNTVTLRIANVTSGPIHPARKSWTFAVVH